MKRNRVGWMGLALTALAAVLFMSGGHHFSPFTQLIKRPSLIPTALAQTAPQAPTKPTQVLSSGLSLSGNYQDPQGRFQIGLLEGYKVNTVANSPLFESADGRLAYTLVVLPIGDGKVTTTVTDAALVQAAQKTFQAGEGFRTTGFQPIEGGGMQISWMGSLTQQGLPQPIQGIIVARQAEANIFLLMVAATEPAVDQIFDAVSTLTGTLQVL
ncbi:MAG: hypothetical protein MJA27_31170 [Pseudanabaenales cyanobacterium]|nr:hypothetical protein [Pseudanabaenales cyanobacterium]